jgi:adenosylhomocysteine nucleosidase
VTIGVIAALEAEARPLAQHTRSRARGNLRALPGGVMVCVSGMGLEAAARGARRLIESGCGALASWGLAGALDPALRPGTVVMPVSIHCEHEPPLAADPAWRAHVSALLPSAVGGGLLTSRRALTTSAMKRTAFERTGAVAVDMESYAIAAVAAASRLPFLSVRVIVDTAEDEVPDVLADASDDSGHIAIGRLIARLIADPRRVGSLIRLAGRYRTARASLYAVARTGAMGSWLQ